MKALFRGIARTLLPFRLRLGLLRLRAWPAWVRERRSGAFRLERGAATAYPFPLAGHSSPLERVTGTIERELQAGKEANVERAAEILDGLVVWPGQVFSHHHSIGRTTRRRGFRAGLELRNGQPAAGVGGGLCQVSNSFYWVAVQAGMEIIERHRHGLDLFPDHERTVPFGCGATVVYNYADFRFRNPLPLAVRLAARVEDGAFVSEMFAEADPGQRVTVAEVDHRFFQVDDQWWRENRLRRRVTSTAGELLVDEEIAHNRGRVMYEPPV